MDKYKQFVMQVSDINPDSYEDPGDMYEKLKSISEQARELLEEGTAALPPKED